MLRVAQRDKRHKLGYGVKQVSAYFGYSRSGYYKARQGKHRREEQKDEVLKLVHRERAQQPRMSGRKLHRLLQEEMEDKAIKMGRDKFYDLLRGHGLLVERRRKGIRTTDSTHAWRRYENLIADKEITAANQVWVCDITYVNTLEGFVYLCLIMDAYSRKILGWCLHDSLEMEGCRRALQQALRTLPKGFTHSQLTHHSDQGVQYCCHAYTSILKQKGVQISMASKGNCYENAQAERLNGILKQEYGLGGVVQTKLLAGKLAKQAVYLYNHRRPHCSLDLHMPAQVHAGQKVKVRMSWSKKRKSKRPNETAKAVAKSIFSS